MVEVESAVYNNIVRQQIVSKRMQNTENCNESHLLLLDSLSFLICVLFALFLLKNLYESSANSAEGAGKTAPFLQGVSFNERVIVRLIKCVNSGLNGARSSDVYRKCS